MTKIIILFISVFIFSDNVSAQDICHNKDRWIFEFHVNDEQDVPIEIKFNKNKELQVINNTEIITLNMVGQSGDTIIYEFPDFYSQLYIVWKNKKTARGYFWDKNKSGRSLIYFKGNRTTQDKFFKNSMDIKPINIANKYKITFLPNSSAPEAAIGLFEQKDKTITGTFLTETGDYRYLSGNVYGDMFYLSCFDGSHLFMFQAKVTNDKIVGTFYSGKNYTSTFIGNEDPNISLANPYALTFKEENVEPFHFQFPRLTGEIYTFPEDAKDNLLTIVQIMGTWCPNCMDETRYYLKLYDKYNNKGLSIIVIGFEYSDDPNFHKERLELFKKRYNIPFEILIGGENSKKQTSEKFPQLNGISSYPTTLFFDKKGTLIKTHTGFSGPGTGQVYVDYKIEMETFIESILVP
jgi:thiol-disulfide isomerase/thioredoxin